ncbi:hypothetical protein L7F22_052250 [Adiantum nelumboides]|nr:hypothetical protein [Adiantum nelumboides]
MQGLLNNMMNSSTIHETVAAAATKRKRANESTGLLQDMLQPFDIAGELLEPPSLSAFHRSHLSLLPSSDQSSNLDHGLPYAHEETLQLSMEDIPFVIKPIENHILYPLKGNSNSIIEDLSKVDSPSLNPLNSQHLNIVHPPPPLNIDNSNATVRSTLRHNAGRPPTKRKGTPSYREAHIHSERQRRQDMASLFHTLRCLLPNIGDDDRFKGDRCTVLGYVIEYLQQLNKEVQELARVRTHLLKVAHHNVVVKKELEEPIKEIQGIDKAQVAHTYNVSVRFWGHVDLFITLNCPKHHGIWPHLMALLQDTLRLDVQNVTLSATPFFYVHTIYAKVADKEERVVSCEKLQEILRQFVAAHSEALE